MKKKRGAGIILFLIVFLALIAGIWMGIPEKVYDIKVYLSGQSFEEIEGKLNSSTINDFCANKGHERIGWYSCDFSAKVTCVDKTKDGGSIYPCYNLSEVVEYVLARETVEDING